MLEGGGVLWRVFGMTELPISDVPIRINRNDSRYMDNRIVTDSS